MSNITDFFPSGGGGASVPLNAISQFANAPVLHTDEQEGVWLKAGYLDTDVASYPSAFNNKYNIADSAFDTSFSLNGLDTDPKTSHFSADGTKMILSGGQNNKLYSFNLSTPWDITTAVHDFKTFHFSSDIYDSVELYSLSFKPDGTRFYVSNTTVGSRKVTQFDMATPWDIENAVQNGIKTDGVGPKSFMGAYWKPDGTVFYILDGNYYITSWNASTPWDITTTPTTYSLLSTNMPQARSYVSHGLFFKDDGTKYYIINAYYKKISEFSLGTAWNITTAAFNSEFDLSSLNQHYSSGPKSLFFKPSGTNLFTVQNGGDIIQDFALSSSWNITSASSSSQLAVGIYDNTQQSFYLKPDGTRFFTVGSTLGKVFTYNIATAEDFSTAGVNRSLDFDLTSEDTFPTGISFKLDGTKMYVLGTTNDSIYEYNLSTPWEPSTSVFSQSFSLSGLNPYNLFFKSDGSSVFLVDATSKSVHRYDLSTYWDISTMVFINSYNVSTLDANPRGVFFNPTGDRMFVSGNTGVTEFSLPSPWDISNVFFLRSLTSTSAFAASFNNEGSLLYVFDYISKTVKQFDIPIGVGLFDDTGLLPNSYIKIK